MNGHLNTPLEDRWETLADRFEKFLDRMEKSEEQQPPQAPDRSDKPVSISKTDPTHVKDLVDKLIANGDIYVYTKSTAKNNHVMAKDLYKSYKDYCEDNGFAPFGIRNFNKIVIGEYSPDPETMNTIYSGYTRFAFLIYNQELT